MNELTPIEKIFFDDSNENVILFNSKDEPVEFEQIAVVPLGDSLYCILKPVIPFEGLGDMDAIVFELNESGDELAIDVVEDEEIVDQIFDIYYSMLKEAIENSHDD